MTGDAGKLNLNQQHYQAELEKMLLEPETRIFLWRLITEDCRVFEEDFQHNATAYSLLAIQRIGKRLLTDAKAINLDAVHSAEKEYLELMRESEAQQHTQHEGVRDYE